MNPNSKSRPSDAHRPASTPWLPAERLGQLDVEPRMRPWLIGKGLISLRMKDACGERYAARLVDQWTGPVTRELKACLKVGESAALFREVELSCAEQVWVFAQSVIPDATLCVHPWLAELGDCSLGEVLATLTGVERSSYEYAWLRADDPFSGRALHGAEVAPSGLWARRSRILLRGAPLLMQEAFLPSTGRT
jgi:chorismate-pyruvate lyase